MRQLYGLIGNPVNGSKSPWVHECLFEHANLDANYLCFNVAKEALSAAVNGLRAIGVQGFNVTIPYKESVIELLDAVDQSASAMGAVNTVAIRNGKMIGYNTDGLGLLKVLERHMGSLENKSVLVLGAGGAAKGICGALLQAKLKRLQIRNRNEERAKDLVKLLHERSQFSIGVQTEPLENETFDLIINTTSVGMTPHEDETPLLLEGLDEQTVICDIVYKPHETLLIKNAKANNMKVIYGIEMLIEQALLAEQIWNDIPQSVVDATRSDLMSKVNQL